MQGLLDKLYGLIQGNTELVKQWTTIYVTFCKVSLLGTGNNNIVLGKSRRGWPGVVALDLC